MTNEEIMERLGHLDALCGENARRIDDICENQKALMSLATSVASMLKTQEYMGEDIKETSNDIKEIKQIIGGLTPQREHDRVKAEVLELQQRPAKRWDGIVDKALWAGIATVITWMATQLVV